MVGIILKTNGFPAKGDGRRHIENGPGQRADGIAGGGVGLRKLIAVGIIEKILGIAGAGRHNLAHRMRPAGAAARRAGGGIAVSAHIYLAEHVAQHIVGKAVFHGGGGTGATRTSKAGVVPDG